MKHMKFAFIAVALIAILSAFATKKNSVVSSTLKKWGLIEKTTVNISGTNYDVVIVDDATGESKGSEYDCVFDPQICTFQADNANLQAGIQQTDFQPFFYASQVDPTLSTPLNSTVLESEGEFVR